MYCKLQSNGWLHAALSFLGLCSVCLSFLILSYIFLTQAATLFSLSSMPTPLSHLQMSDAALYLNPAGTLNLAWYYKHNKVSLILISICAQLISIISVFQFFCTPHYCHFNLFLWILSSHWSICALDYRKEPLNSASPHSTNIYTDWDHLLKIEAHNPISQR